MAGKEISQGERSHSICGGFRATIPHLVIENGGCNYSKHEIEEMYKYINNKDNPISKQREESIADIHIDRVFRRKCMRGVEEFLKIEFQVNSCTVSDEVPCKKVKREEKEEGGNNHNNTFVDKNESGTTGDSGIILSDKQCIK
uniref:U-box domain-containing protein n=1 Tax=Strongyloides papillosus TaxID=174720 RepID=A0A0N5C9A9_STREA